MFTGLVETTGRLESRAARGPGYRIVVATELAPLEMGESISVNGACLTVAGLSARAFDADVSVETLERTTLGDTPIGGQLNLERSLRFGDRLGGHLVTGHVDGIAIVTSVSPAGEALRVRARAPEQLAPYLASKGSVALDGVSLTVNAVEGSDFELMLIPHTLQVTTLSTIAPGRRLNLEVDLLARYVVRYLEATRGGRENEGMADLEGALKRAGFI